MTNAEAKAMAEARTKWFRGAVNLFTKPVDLRAAKVAFEAGYKAALAWRSANDAQEAMP